MTGTLPSAAAATAPTHTCEAARGIHTSRVHEAFDRHLKRREGNVSDPESEALTDMEYRLLTRAEHGYTFRPADARGEDFGALVDRLRRLRGRGLLRLEEGRIMTSQSGDYLLAGPCDLTAAGRQALEYDRRFGPRA